MRIYTIKIKKIYIFACVLGCLCAAFVLLHVNSCRKMSIGAFLAYSNADGRKSEKVEIFDIEAGSVIRSFENSAVFRKEACKYLDSITGMYGNIKVFPIAGYIVKIPLEPPVEASGKLMEAAGIEYIDKIYVILPSQGKPYLLILDGQAKPFCFNFDADTSFPSLPPLRLLLKKAQYVINKLKELKLPEAVRKVEQGIAETLTYLSFPSEYWLKIRTTNFVERLNRNIRRRTWVVGTFPDGNSALMLVCARLRPVAGTAWGIKRYMNIVRLDELNREDEFVSSDG